MSEPIIYVDNAEIREGQFEALNAAMKELSLFVLYAGFARFPR